MDTAKYRAEFPVVERLLYLNHASEAPVSRPVRQLVETYLTAAESDPDAAPHPGRLARQLLSQLLGGAPEEYALMPNTATGLGIVANGLEWQSGDNVVVPEEEHPAGVMPWETLTRLGVEVRRVPLHNLRVDLVDVARLVDDRTRVLSVSAVEYVSGFRHNLKALSEIAHERGAIFAVDGIQAAGMVPVNVAQDGIDVLAAGGYKWLLGPVGTGFMYINRDLWDVLRPVLPGAHSMGLVPSGWTGKLAETAQRYQTGSMPFSLIYGWTAGLAMLLEAGVPTIHRHLLTLTDRAMAGLAARGLTVLSPVADEQERSGILVFTTGSLEGNEALVKRLQAKGIIIALRMGRCRISPHFYNTEADIDRFLEALA
jgi:selenocysteine lyase/cysteine desulfurase